MIKRTLTAFAFAAMAASSAHAQLTFSGGTDLLSINNYNPTGITSPQTQGKKDSVLSAGVGGTLTATFLGYEADDTDNFAFDFGVGTLTNKTSLLGATIAGPVAGGNLVFTFKDLQPGSSVTVGNGGTGATFGSYAILGSFAGGVFTPYTNGGLYDLVVGFNDGLTVDADYDDLVVGLKLVTNPVPEPETYMLMLAGLGALAYVARRRKAA